jgi:hypothetical protein
VAFMTKSLKNISHIWFSGFRHGPCWPFGLWLARNSLGQVLLLLLTGHTPQWWSYRLIPLQLFGVVILHHPHFIFGKGKQQISPQIWLTIELWTLWIRSANISFLYVWDHSTIKQKDVGSIHDGVTAIFHRHMSNPSGHTMVLMSTLPLTNISTWAISLG